MRRWSWKRRARRDRGSARAPAPAATDRRTMNACNHSARLTGGRFVAGEITWAESDVENTHRLW
jgi:hypothetical protein